MTRYYKRIAKEEGFTPDQYPQEVRSGRMTNFRREYEWVDMAANESNKGNIKSFMTIPSLIRGGSKVPTSANGGIRAQPRLEQRRRCCKLSKVL